MRTSKKIFYLVLFLILASAYFWRSHLEDLFYQSQQKISDFSKTAENLVTEKIQKSVSTPPPLRAEDKTTGARLTKAGVLQWTNTNRRDNGNLPALTENAKLDKAALEKAQDMFTNQYFEHVSPSGKGPQDLAADVNYNYVSIGENLALGNFSSDKDLLDAWMASPGHRANILNPGFTEIGVAVVPGRYEGKDTWIGVQEFGAPLSLCPTVDTELKNTIETDNKKIAQLASKLATLRNQINDMKTSDSDLPQAIKDYNSQVKSYNDLVEQTKSLVENYNNQVNELNTCVKSRTQQ